MVVMVQLYCLFLLLSFLQFLGGHYYLVQKLYHSYPTHLLPSSLVQIVQIHLPQRYDNHNREPEFPSSTPPEVQTQMKNTLNLHETPHP